MDVELKPGFKPTFCPPSGSKIAWLSLEQVKELLREGSLKHSNVTSPCGYEIVYLAIKYPDQSKAAELVRGEAGQQ